MHETFINYEIVFQCRGCTTKQIIKYTALGQLVTHFSLVFYIASVETNTGDILNLGGRSF